MERRSLLAALAATGLIAPGAAASATSGTACSEGDDMLIRCSVGFSDLPPIPAQPCRALCWATCLAYILRGYGATVTEADVLAWHGLDGTCGPHSDRSRIMASAGHWTDQAGREFLVAVSSLAGIDQWYVTDPRFPDLLDRLHRQPVLCGAAGHATVLTELRTSGDRFGRIWRDGARVLDPHAPTRGERDLTEAELERPGYVLGIAIRPA